MYEENIDKTEDEFARDIVKQVKRKRRIYTDAAKMTSKQLAVKYKITPARINQIRKDFLKYPFGIRPHYAFKDKICYLVSSTKVIAIIPNETGTEVSIKTLWEI